MTVEFMSRAINIGTCALVTMVVLLVEHLALSRKLERPWTYVAGLLGLGVPYGVLLAFWGSWPELAAFVVMVACGGGVVLLGYDVRLKEEVGELQKEVNRMASIVMEARGGKWDGGADG